MSYRTEGYSRYFEKDLFGGPKEYYGSESNSSIINFEWDKGRGGVVHLGGGDNSDGFLIVLDNKGEEKLRISNRGIVLIGHTIIGTDPDGKETVHTLP